MTSLITLSLHGTSLGLDDQNLKEKIKSIEAKLVESETKEKTLNDALDALLKRIESAEERSKLVTSLEAKVNALEVENKTLRSELEAKAKEHTEAVVKLQSDFSAFKTTLKDNEGKIECVICKELIPMKDIITHINAHGPQSGFTQAPNLPMIFPSHTRNAVVSKNTIVPVVPSTSVNPLPLPIVQPFPIPPSQADPKPVELVECPICGKKFSEGEIAKHVDGHSGTQFECPFCFKDLGNAQSLQHHVETEHQ
ncbi:hypothetical protein EIN_496830 [Entamoeba invadens IP1]|uniref:C2H2-type domain-containing protein n=2 Tax=Entamoeba invadens TaxID=33085 RepID=A0A0A1U5P9_ENTIV|nr:hypothetical protein EIN_496830 [Entamoeba invadens IP1]ELP87128.1 hypothetical protein EIN_496830 [Entamoeba invadens IP1]BAN41042.1 hypothetical protein [Entamoeba invadens]|eukprot:XP_004253899.1 hypothetical protein EIN_496830 [Entamoeba invadens IP1]